MDASTLLPIIPIAGIVAVLFAIYLARDVLARDTGTPEMQAVAGTILEGAVAFIRRQYTTIFVLAVVGAFVIGGVITLVETPEVADVPKLAGVPIGLMTAFAFFVGALCSMASGIIGMYISVKANVRTASAARRSLVEAVQVAMRGGAVSGFLVVALSLLGVWGIFTLYETVVADVTVAEAPFLIVGFGFGASFVALFAQLGGGIYTKAADVGSDLVGKVEKGIPEDDPRNAGVVADLVGDNVGDCAGRGADLFESTAAENIGAMILGVAVYTIAVAAGWPNPEAWIFFPLVVRAFGLLATIVAIFFVRGKETEDPMNMLNRGYWVTTLLSVVGMAFVTFVMMNTNGGTGTGGLPTWVYFFAAGVVGLATSVAFVYITQFYTAGSFRPVREIAEASKTGPATNIISGTAVGFETTLVTAVTISIALFASFWLGDQAGLIGEGGRNVGGIFGTAVATMGMLMTTAYILAMDTFGPDHGQRRRHRRVQPRGGRRPRDHRPPRRGRQHDQGPDQGLRDRLGVARGVPAVLRLHRQDQRHPGPTHRGQRPRCRSCSSRSTSPTSTCSSRRSWPRCSSTSSARSRSARSARPRSRSSSRSGASSGRCPGSWTTASARITPASWTSRPRRPSSEMIVPGVVAVATPIIIGVVLGYEAVAGMLMVGTISGVMLATVLNNGGGAWDNAKKYIESGQPQG